MSQTDLSIALPDNPGKTVLSLIENGHVMPTAELLDSICKVLDCSPFDLYSPDDLNLSNSVGGERTENGKRTTIFIPEELIEAIIEVGYSDIGEWIRESKRRLLSITVTITTGTVRSHLEIIPSQRLK